MSLLQTTYAQSSFDLFGNAGNYKNSTFRLNSLEGNPGNFTRGKDWELSVIFGSTLNEEATGNVYLISLSKKLGAHNLYGRFTPGINKEFIFNSGVDVVSDSQEVSTTLKTNLQYEEKFGFGYSFEFAQSFSAGFSFRFFNQEFTSETAVPVFSDTLNYIVTEASVDEKQFWKGDLGINFIPFENLSVSVASNNLIIVKENSSIDETYEMQNKKGVIFSLAYSPFQFLNLIAKYETNSSFLGGLSLSTDLFGGRLTFGSSLIHDKYINPTIAGIMPAINYSTGFYSITLSGIKYFTNSDNENLLSDFTSNGFHNLLNNQYSDDKAFLGINFALSFKPEKSVRFIDVEIKRQIFPTLSEDYLIEPFAYGRVVNITDRLVTVKPSSIIKDVNNEQIFSPTVVIQPKDTMLIPFFTNINIEQVDNEDREISQANFYLTVLNEEPDDALQRPILVNNSNSWDGKVINLKHFVKKGMGFANKFAKNILQDGKDKLFNVPSGLADFEKVKLLFNKYVKEMIYVADPRTSSEYVQFPSETIELKGGDCDDLSVGFASLLESIGIETAFVDFKSQEGIRHVNLLINTKLTPSQSKLITINDKKYFVRSDERGNDEVWIPLEMTSLTDFEPAWSIGSEKFSREAIDEFGLAKGIVEIIDIN